MELVAPAGNVECAKAAVDAGADAIYVGGKSFSMRQKIPNMSIDEIELCVQIAHRGGCKVFLAVNSMIHESEIHQLESFLQSVCSINIDAIVAWDPAVVVLCSELGISTNLHMSTMAGLSNSLAHFFWKQSGVTRVVLPRELNLIEATGLIGNSALEIEVFVHGSTCISYSGRCWLSNYMVNEDANHGRCNSVCRKRFAIAPGPETDGYLVIEDESGAYLMNSKNLCLIDRIPDLVEMGVNAIKIEGRQRGIKYVSEVTQVYREAIDECQTNVAAFGVHDHWREVLEKWKGRGYWEGHMFGEPGLSSVEHSVR